MSARPLLVYIPGLLPKPKPDLHREQLWRCLLAGIDRVDADVADALRSSPTCFELVSWTFDFYGVHRDIACDLDDIERLLKQRSPTPRDMAEAYSWRRRLAIWLYRLGDLMPFLIPRLANEKLEVHLRDLRRYVRDVDDAAQTARRALQRPLREAASAGRPVLLIAHSMGSVIAFDALWQLTRVDGQTVPVDLWLTLGSPLGQNYLQKRILGRDHQGADRYPQHVRCWANVAAYGDMTALDRHLASDFGEMVQLGLVEEIVDYAVFNHYRSGKLLNTHAEYGYLANETVARLVSEWWRVQSAPSGAGAPP